MKPVEWSARKRLERVSPKDRETEENAQHHCKTVRGDSAFRFATAHEHSRNVLDVNYRMPLHSVVSISASDSLPVIVYRVGAKFE